MNRRPLCPRQRYSGHNCRGDRIEPAAPGLARAGRPEGAVYIAYALYHRVLPDGRRILLALEPVPEPAYWDQPPTGRVAYAVTAVDRSRRRNESAPSAEVPVLP